MTKSNKSTVSLHMILPAMLGLFFVGIVDVLADKVYNFKFSRANWGVATFSRRAKKSALQILFYQTAPLFLDYKIREHHIHTVENRLTAGQCKLVSRTVFRVLALSTVDSPANQRLNSNQGLLVDVNNYKVDSMARTVHSGRTIFPFSSLLTSFIDSYMPVSIKEASEVLWGSLNIHTNILTKTRLYV